MEYEDIAYQAENARRRQKPAKKVTTWTAKGLEGMRSHEAEKRAEFLEACRMLGDDKPTEASKAYRARRRDAYMRAITSRVNYEDVMASKGLI